MTNDGASLWHNRKEISIFAKKLLYMKHLYFLMIVLFSLNATAQLKDCATCASQVIDEEVYDIGEYEVIESATYWRFKWRNQKLVFIESGVAG